MGKLLTTEQLAERIGVHPYTILQWAKDGLLPIIRLSPRTLRYDEDVIDQWLRRRENGVPDEETA